LPQRNVERRPQRVVEDCIARAVGKIGENDGVFIGERSCRLRRVRAEIERSSDCSSDNYYGCATGTSATFTALDEGDGAGTGEEPDADDGCRAAT
jgi:hypothetical protein